MTPLLLVYIHLNTLFLIFLFLFIVLQSNIVVVVSATQNRTASCLHSQWLALSQLRAMNMMEWNMKEEENCCTWDGVSCDPATGYVTGLDLSFSMLSAEIFPIFNLHHLQTLNLSCNNFNYTSFPSGFEKLKNLTHLNLSQTSFSGQIPVGISRLTRLVSLDLSGMPNSVELRKPNLESFSMNLTSLKEVYLDGLDLSAQGSNWSQVLSSALPHLEVLSLSYFDLNGPIHPSFATLKSLSYLQLRVNNLSSDFPENVFLLPNLKTIDISCNHLLSGQFPEFPKHTYLQRISLSQTNFHGELPESIGNLQSLKFLDIFSCKISGLIPSSLANLTSIIELDIKHNRFTGSLPPFHSTSVPNLSYLDMSFNLLTGGIHSSLFMLPSLEYLYLADNKFSGELDEYSNNTSSSVLECLYLNDNQLSGVVPKSIFELPNLIHLSLISNNFNGSVKIEMLQNLKNLEALDLSSISLTVEENDDRSFHLPHLRGLYLQKCNLYDFPIFLKNQVQLTHLNLAHNHIRGYVPTWLGNNSNLEDLDLSGNLIDFLEPSSAMGNTSFTSLYSVKMHSCNISKFPKFLKGLDGLEYLDLSDNKIEGEIPGWIWTGQLNFVSISHNCLSALDEFPSNISLNVFALYLHGNRIRGSLPSGICNMGYLNVLDVSDNNLSGLIPECLLKHIPLKVLNLKGNRYHQMPSNFTLTGNLVTLNINGNRLKGKLPRSLANCKMLEILDLGNNMISDTFPFWLEKLLSLKVLILRNNMFYGEVEIPRTKFVLPSLRIIDLSSNNFPGELSIYFLKSLTAMAMGGENKSLPSLIGEHDDYYHDSVNIVNKGYEMVLLKILTIFVSLDLSNNKFHGNVLEEIGELKSLVVLNLSRNSFDGQIPTSLGELSQLESLDFSLNKFSGMIPPQLTSLTFLEVLNMSYNQLAGHIPLGNQFNTFTNGSYIGNAGLCGTPLSRKCTEDDVPVAHDESWESEETMFDWKFAVAGCGFGLVVGLTIGFTFLAEWIIKWVVKHQQKKKHVRRNRS